MPSLAQSVTMPPPTVTAMKYTRNMITTKMGRPSQRLVTTRSIFCVVVMPLRVRFTTVLSTTWLMAS